MYYSSQFPFGNDRHGQQYNTARIPRIALTLNKLNFVGDWRLITFPARSSFLATSIADLVRSSTQFFNMNYIFYTKIIRTTTATYIF